MVPLLRRELCRRLAAGLRRVSVSVAEADTRRYFVPRGTSLRIDLNLLASSVLRQVAAGVIRAGSRSRGR